MTELMTKQRPEEAWTSPFEAFVGARSEPDWLLRRRRDAMTRFDRLGFPSRRDEAWRYTKLNPITQHEYVRSDELPSSSVTDEELSRFTYWETASARLVFVNGRYDAELSSVEGLPSGVRVEPLSQVLATSPDDVAQHLGGGDGDDALTSLNFAYAIDGAFVHVPRGARPEGAIHLLFLGRSADERHVAHIRNVVVIDEGAEVAIVERYAGLDQESTYFTNAVTRVTLEADAALDHHKIQRESLASHHLSRLDVAQEQTSRFRTTLISVGAALGRTDVNVDQNGDGVESVVNGLYVADGERHSDNQVRIHHRRDHGSSEQLYKGILSDRASGVFNGAIVVDEGTKGTDAHQTNKNLLLSEEATINTKPQLEIDADDVRCSHGATIGQLDRDALFYLRSRGLPESEARALLTYAFASDVVDAVRIEPIRARIHEFLATRTEWGAIQGDTRA